MPFGQISSLRHANTSAINDSKPFVLSLCINPLDGPRNNPFGDAFGVAPNSLCIRFRIFSLTWRLRRDVPLTLHVGIWRNLKQPFITANSQTTMNIIIYRDPSTKYPAPYTRVFPIYSTRAAVAIRNSHNSHTTIALGPPAQRDRIIRSNPLIRRRPVHVMPIIHSALDDAYVYPDWRARGKTKRHDTQALTCAQFTNGLTACDTNKNTTMQVFGDSCV